MQKLRTREYAQGNKAGNLLASRLRQQQQASKIPFLIQSDGTKIYNPQYIADELAKYYSGLYNLKHDDTIHQPTNTDISDFLTWVQLPTLTPEQQQTLQNPITVDEIIYTINAQPTGQSPGPDGLPNQYYKAYYNTLGPPLLRAYQDMIQT
ncbi:endonuclease [Pelobates cultripes]|uniref:Endonuclease, partial n=1 Tax=Pelobates cultripes TaxID=61616 RepID=A0AAD1RQR2_PELCU|nr:endonuclease [Pelobates cultripes]